MNRGLATGACFETKLAIGALAALAQESRLAVFRLLVQAGAAGLAASKIAEQLEIPLVALLPPEGTDACGHGDAGQGRAFPVAGILLGRSFPAVFQAIGAMAPLVALLLGLSAITVPWDTLFTSVALYIVIPVILAQLLRKALLAKGAASLERAREARAIFDFRAAGHAGAAVRLPGRRHRQPAADHRPAGGADPDPGVPELGTGLLAAKAAAPLVAAATSHETGPGADKAGELE